jgi:predicted helicase
MNNEYYAVQCKFRQNPFVIIPWQDFATFFGLSFGMNNKNKKGFLVTNTYDLCNEVIKSNKVDSIYGDYFDSLPDNFFDNIRNILNNKPLIEYKKKTPFPHQIVCVIDCDNYFEEHNKGYIIKACGTGKTLTS